MKNLAIVLAFLFCFQSVTFSQTKGKQFAVYSTVGIKAGGGLSVIRNKDISKDNSLNNNGSSLLYNYGIKVGINYIGTKPVQTLLSLNFEYLLSGFGQKITDITLPTTSYNKYIKYDTENLVFLFRYTNAAKRWFCEGGTQLTRIRGVKESNSVENSSFSDLPKANYSNYNSLVVGGGVYIKKLVVGVRFSPGLGSICGAGKNAMIDGVYNDVSINPDYAGKYNNNSPTKHSAFIVTVEYYIPFMAFSRGSCGGSGFSIFKRIDTKYYWPSKGYWYN